VVQQTRDIYGRVECRYRFIDRMRVCVLRASMGAWVRAMSNLTHAQGITHAQWMDLFIYIGSVYISE